MSKAFTQISALLISVGLLLMGNGLQGTLLPVRATIEAFGTLPIGLMGAAYYLGFGFGCLYGPYLARRSGHIRTFTAMVALASSVALLHALVVGPLVWTALRFATGFCFAVLYMVIESWLNEKSTNDSRGRVFAVYTTINLTVITLGQMMLVAAPPEAFTLFALSSILVSLAAVPLAFTRSDEPAPIETVAIRFRPLYDVSAVAVAGCVTVGLGAGAFWTLGPVFAQTLLGGTSGVAMFMSAAVLAGALAQWPLGLLSDHMDRRRVIVLAALGSVLAAAAMPWLTDGGYWLILGLGAAFGLFAFPIHTLSVAHANDHVEPQDYVVTASGLLLLFALGAAAGPLVAALVMKLWGPASLFSYFAVVYACLAAFALYRIGNNKPAPSAERGEFADALKVALNVSTVDPLNDDGDREPAVFDKD